MQTTKMDVDIAAETPRECFKLASNFLQFIEREEENAYKNIIGRYFRVDQHYNDEIRGLERLTMKKNVPANKTEGIYHQLFDLCELIKERMEGNHSKVPLTVEILLPESSSGYVIGSHGKTLKTIRNTNGNVSILVDDGRNNPEPVPEGYFRLLIFSPRIEDVRSARARVIGVYHNLIKKLEEQTDNEYGSHGNEDLEDSHRFYGNGRNGNGSSPFKNGNGIATGGGFKRRLSPDTMPSSSQPPVKRHMSILKKPKEESSFMVGIGEPATTGDLSTYDRAIHATMDLARQARLTAKEFSILKQEHACEIEEKLVLEHEVEKLKGELERKEAYIENMMRNTERMNFKRSRCVECKKRERSTVFIPCGHVQLCIECANEETSTLVCPECNTHGQKVYALN